MSAYLFRGWEFEKINKAEFFVLYKLKIQIYISVEINLQLLEQSFEKRLITLLPIDKLQVKRKNQDNK